MGSSVKSKSEKNKKNRVQLDLDLKRTENKREYLQFPETYHNYLKTNGSGDSVTDISKEEEKICFEKKNLKTEKNKLKFCVHYIENFRLTFSHVVSILSVLSKGSSVIDKILKFLLKNKICEKFENKFPIRISMPIGYTFKAKMNFQNFEFFEKKKEENNFFIPL